MATITAGAKKEIEYLRKFGRPLHPIQRLRREIYNYQKQSQLEHIENLEKYLSIAPRLMPNEGEKLALPTLRHPDLQPNNIFVSDNFEITGLIDWQHCAVLPLFLQCGIPKSFQNYGDSVSESMQTPEIHPKFDALSEREQFQELEIFRKRQLHYQYVTTTARLNPTHYDSLTDNLSALRSKIYRHASDPWEGDNVTLKTDLINVMKNWQEITRSDSCASKRKSSPCPIAYTEDEVRECLRLISAQIEADEQLEACQDVIGVGPEGWVPAADYESAKYREKTLKTDALNAAASAEEKSNILEHWVFDDFDESDYM